MSRTNYKDVILAFYNDFIAVTEHSDSNAVAWSTKETQYMRFIILNEIGVTNEDTILDLGCGMGHYTDFLALIEYPLEKYTGIDINEKYVESCRMRKPELRFLHGEIFDLSEPFDYVVGSGIFTVGMSKNEVLEAIAYAYSICNKGVAFNFLTKEYLDDPKYNTFVPEEFYNELKVLYPTIRLITDYIGNEDFTIYIDKDGQR